MPPYHRMGIGTQTFDQRLHGRTVERISERDGGVPAQDGRPPPTHCRRPVPAFELPATHPQECDERRARCSIVERPVGLAPLVPRALRRRTGRLANVAAPDPVADQRSHRHRDRADPLRQIRDAPVGIDRIISTQRPCRAGVNAPDARAAALRERRVRRQFDARDDLAQKDERAERRRDEIRVLSNPAKAGPCRKRTLC